MIDLRKCVVQIGRWRSPNSRCAHSSKQKLAPEDFFYFELTTVLIVHGLQLYVFSDTLPFGFVQLSVTVNANLKTPNIVKQLRV